MASITSASTEAQISAAYLDNAGYEEDDSLSMAKAFVTVVLAMMKRGISRIKHGDEIMEFDNESLRALLANARQFVADKSGPDAGGAGVRAFDLSSFRG